MTKTNYQQSLWINMKSLSTKIPDELAHRLQQKIVITGKNQSNIVREALEAYLNHTATGTFGEMAQDLCGVINGPTDLSANPDHMDDYGR